MVNESFGLNNFATDGGSAQSRKRRRVDSISDVISVTNVQTSDCTEHREQIAKLEDEKAELLTKVLGLEQQIAEFAEFNDRSGYDLD
jgi:hypothetical protein